jgi:hypothetical protein
MAMIIVPEEAEQIYSILHGKVTSPTHLLTYAAPVTRKMLHFNGFKYYAAPALPAEWQAPTWLKIELGIFAGRLYFDYEEYPALCDFLGLVDDDIELKEEEATCVDNVVKTSDNIEVVAENFWILKAAAAQVKKSETFTAKPLTFMQEWLSLRRKGQDFAQTPMGYVCQGKPLKADHPFFTKVDNHVQVPGEHDKEEVDVGGTDEEEGAEECTMMMMIQIMVMILLARMKVMKMEILLILMIHDL